MRSVGLPRATIILERSGSYEDDFLRAPFQTKFIQAQKKYLKKNSVWRLISDYMQIHKSLCLIK